MKINKKINMINLKNLFMRIKKINSNNKLNSMIIKMEINIKVLVCLKFLTKMINQ
jgi:hypothetical protein